MRRTVERLDRRLARVAREQGLDQERLRRWVSFLALCGALEGALQEGVLDTYYLKGGVAMELRFAQRARATKDMDLGIEGTRTTRIQRLSEALARGFDEFTFRVKAQVRHMDQADTVRVQVAIQYRTRSWQTVEVDLGPVSMGQVDLIEPRVQGLVELGIPVASPVRCLGIADQVAQKLHACTGPAATGRARDVLDILLIDALGQLDYAETANAAQRVFEERATHAFPPAFVMPAEWRPELEALAADLDFPLKTSAAIERRFLEVLQKFGGQRAGY
ncbi:MAG TPA: nucleotidyl transferase AbiEii/AbiGii toxin family protein [Bryobacteraceae bacterium]|nr:nucleotidyl transferase AbiEii/AbiGii toxin family protein [Bryobacteraceae bacterium]